MFKNKNVVITGATDGIGLGITHAFAEQGANLVLIARDVEKLARVKDELTLYKICVNTFSADLSITQDIPFLVQNILKEVSEVDILINNAGIARFIPFREMNEDILDMHLNLNVKAPYLLTQSLFSSLSKRNGNVINISSYFSHRMLPGRDTTAYSLTKGAVDSFTKSLAFEAGKEGVRVNAIAPGSIDTSQLRYNIEQLSEERKKNFREMIKTIYPLGRIGEVEDVAQVAVFLASDKAKWITGTILQVDGGLTTN